jgi:iron(III) transport system ATP-binding protein
MSMLVELDNVCLSYGAHRVVEALSLRLPRRRIGCLLGPSGCGKTSLLRCIAGFEPIHAGQIRLADNIVSSPTRHVPPEARRVGMVFQDYALFPHLDVEKNVAFGLRRLGRDARRRRVDELLAVTGLDPVRHRFPHELSGGQQQRVALARALAPKPDLLLLDEPFSSLDFDLRDRLSAEVRELLRQQGSTVLLVTHDQHEAFAMADEIGVMAAGRIQQWDSAYNIYHRPANRFVADFVGQGVFLPGHVSDGRVEMELGALVGEIRLAPAGAEPADREVEVLLRPDDVVHDDSSPTRATILHKAFRGAEILYTLRLRSGRKILALVPSHHDHAIGSEIGIRLETDHIVAFPRAPAR